MLLVGIFAIAFFIFIIIDTLVHYRLSTWIEKNWRKSPRTLLRERREEKAAEIKREARARQQKAYLELVQHFAEKSRYRQEARRTWDGEFRALERAGKPEEAKSLDDVHIELLHAYQTWGMPVYYTRNEMRQKLCGKHRVMW